jgi:hypothetical protein
MRSSGFGRHPPVRRIVVEWTEQSISIAMAPATRRKARDRPIAPKDAANAGGFSRSAERNAAAVPT